jgi:hypothetical protein
MMTRPPVGSGTPAQNMGKLPTATPACPPDLAVLRGVEGADAVHQADIRLPGGVALESGVVEEAVEAVCRGRWAARMV